MIMIPAWVLWVTMGWLVIGGLTMSKYVEEHDLPDTPIPIVLGIFFWPGMFATFFWRD
jgi:hypothetical protein